MISYKHNTATRSDINKHFQECIFIPKLNTYVNINSYIKKILNFSERFEAWDRNKLVGLAAIYNNKDKKEGFLTNLSVINNYTKEGIGSSLMEKISIYIKESGFNYIRLEVFSDNEKAIKFYQKNGFVHLSTINNKIIMLKKI